MKSGDPHGGFVHLDRLSYSQKDTHLHHTKSECEHEEAAQHAKH